MTAPCTLKELIFYFLKLGTTGSGVSGIGRLYAQRPS
jgi:hypothetical protein